MYGVYVRCFHLLWRVFCVPGCVCVFFIRSFAFFSSFLFFSSLLACVFFVFLQAFSTNSFFSSLVACVLRSVCVGGGGFIFLASVESGDAAFEEPNAKPPCGVPPYPLHEQDPPRRHLRDQRESGLPGIPELTTAVSKLTITRRPYKVVPTCKQIGLRVS